MERKAFKTTDIIIVLGVLALALAVFFYYRSINKPAAVVHLNLLSTGETIEIPLDKDDIYHFNATLPITIEVQNGAARFIDSQCSDHICEGFGYIKNSGEYATCLPGGAHLEIPLPQ